MIDSTYDPQKVTDFEKSKLNFSGKGVYGSCSESTTENIDFVLTDDVLLTGGIMRVKNGKFQDKITLQVIHPVAGVVNEFITDFGINEDAQKQFDISLPYGAKLPAGLSIRCVFTACADVGLREITVNYYLHKCML
jgi:hypothetical protein